MSHNCQEFKIENYLSRAIVIEQFSSYNFGDKNNISLSITIVGIRFMSKTVPAQSTEMLKHRIRWKLVMQDECYKCNYYVYDGGCVGMEWFMQSDEYQRMMITKRRIYSLLISFSGFSKSKTKFLLEFFVVKVTL